MIFETHAHYDDKQFDKDREALLSSMPKNGIDTIVNVGASLSSTAAGIALAQQYAYVYAAAGVHPNETGELNEENFAGCGNNVSIPRWWQSVKSVWIIIGINQNTIYRKNGLCASLNWQGRLTNL